MDKNVVLEFIGNRGYFSLFNKEIKIGELSFILQDNVMIMDHTEVNDEYKGQGLARYLLDCGIDYAMANNYKIQPVCSYVVRVFEKEANLAGIKA